MQVLLRALFCKFRRILAHQRKTDIRHRKQLPHTVQYRNRILPATGQHQMPHDHALLQKPVPVKGNSPHLPMHLHQCLGGVVGIIRRSGIGPRQIGGHVFEIRQIYVHKPVQTAEHIHTLVSP